MTNIENRKITWQTCPITGLRERRSDCVLGRKARKEYDRMITEILAIGGETVDMFVFAETKGRETLEQLEERWREANDEKTNKQKSLFSQAEIQLRANLSLQKSTYHISDGIRRRAKIRIFEKMREEDEKYQKFSRKVHGIKKAMESLEKYLNFDLPAMRKDCEEKRAAEGQIKASA